MRFHIFGHKNILGTHKTTIEFTKDPELSLKGNCILGVKADFDFNGLLKIINKCSKIKIRITIEGISDEVIGFANKGFNDKTEIVIRKSDYISKRTLCVRADKAAIDINRKIVEYLKRSDASAIVEITGLLT